MPIEFAEGLKRPLNPVHAAKFASEGGMLARSHMPVLPHIKEYKKDETLLKNYIGKVAVSTCFLSWMCSFISVLLVI